MNVILLEKIHNLGNLGDLVNVKAGYGRNFLIPQGKAAAANKANIAKFEARRAEIEQVALVHLHAAQARLAKLADLTVTIPMKTAEEGRLFGSVGTADLADAVNKVVQVDLKKSEVHLPAGPLRELGEYEVLVQLHADVECNFKVIIVAEA